GAADQCVVQRGAGPIAQFVFAQPQTGIQTARGQQDQARVWPGPDPAGTGAGAEGSLPRKEAPAPCAAGPAQPLCLEAGGRSLPEANRSSAGTQGLSPESSAATGK